jgi:2-oxoglutarate dehydrogenase E1 component
MKYPGQKRFSLEGGETLIPMLNGLLNKLAEIQLQEAMIGMAHRGRLNVLANVLGKSYAEIFSEFEDHYIPCSFEGSGDVKYHMGYHSRIQTLGGRPLALSIAPNPSHLESVNPVVEGFVRAKQDMQKQKPADHRLAVAILIHGDASLAGQGVVYETMQMWNLEGYQTGGTLHIAVNNQVGFTAEAHETRSTTYCTDIAKSFNAPVLHVNAEDPESCVYAACLAAEIRQRFHIDVFIELCCYRKYGHNETDEPSFTQPLLYQKIKGRRNIRDIYRQQLIDQNVLSDEEVDCLEEQFTKELEEAQKNIKQDKPPAAQPDKNKESAENIDTKLAREQLVMLNHALYHIPENFAIHSKLKRIFEHRQKMTEQDSSQKAIDWAVAESLAFASLLVEGHPIRLSGQDSARGTFSQRHAVLTDQKNGEKYIPLNHISQDQAEFSVQNSLLSEFAAMGFELGYSYAREKAFILWEGQFGDFANGAQIIIDQYLVSGKQKWNWSSSITLLLPHGFEGQGPEHSSARIERFLQLSADKNIRIVYPTTPAQLFHALRRQKKAQEVKPLILFTPKGLLRYPASYSALEEFYQQDFQKFIDDPEIQKKDIQKVCFCAGRVFYDLVECRAKEKRTDVAIIRVEQLYPFSRQEFVQILQGYAQAGEWIWVQEEHQNAGCWNYIASRIQRELPQNNRLRYVGRKESASTAVGSSALHKKQLAEFIHEIFS